MNISHNDDVSRFYNDFKDFIDGNRFLKEFLHEDEKIKATDPAIGILLKGMEDAYPEMLPAIPLLYFAITGNIIAKGTAIKVPHVFMNKVFRNSWYIKIRGENKYFRDDDYKADGLRTVGFVNRCDDREFDPNNTEDAGCYLIHTHRYDPTIYLTLHLYGGDYGRMQQIEQDVEYLVRSTYVGQLERIYDMVNESLKASITKIMQASVEGTPLLKIYPEMAQYIKAAD